MAGISSKAAGKLENRYKYNGIELDTSLGLNAYEAHFRDLDPAIGRWWQIDPKIEQGMESLSPYISMSNNPILRSDPLGDLDDDCCKELWNDIKSAVKETATSAYNGAVSVARTFNTYVNPLASVAEVVTGKSTESDFTAAKPRSISGMEAAISIIPGAKLEGAIIKAEVKALDKALVTEVSGAMKEVNANSKASTKLNTLYKLESTDGKYLKTGITSQSNIEKRYTKGFLQDKKMTPLAQGSRAEMLKKERDIVEKNPGPLNREPWAGKKQNQ
jgi:RHS repeat-associated protein